MDVFVICNHVVPRLFVKGHDVDDICEVIDELRHQAHIAKFTDLAARDIVCEMTNSLRDLAAKVREIERLIVKAGGQDDGR